MNADVKKELEAAENRLGELMLEYDELEEANRRRCKELIQRVADGEVPEAELLSAQTIAESRENIQRSAVISYEEEIVRPLRARVRRLNVSEFQREVQRLDKESAAARGRLDDFLTTVAERERDLRAKVHELEEASARLQRTIRKMNTQPL